MVTLSDINEQTFSKRGLRKIDEITEEMIKRVIKYAEENIVPHSMLEAMIDGHAPPVGDNKYHNCTIRPYRVVYSIEEQAIGLCRHLSVSLPKSRSIPNLNVLNELIEMFGFEGDIHDCYVWIEDLTPIRAVNLVQPLKWDRETSTLT